MPLPPRRNSARFVSSRPEKRPGPGSYDPRLLPRSRTVSIGKWRGLGTGWQLAPDISLPGPGTYELQPTFISSKPVPQVQAHTASSPSMKAAELEKTKKLHHSLFVENPVMKTTAEFQTRVVEIFEATALGQLRAKAAKLPTFADVKFNAEKEVLQMRQLKSSFFCVPIFSPIIAADL